MYAHGALRLRPNIAVQVGKWCDGLTKWMRGLYLADLLAAAALFGHAESNKHAALSKRLEGILDQVCPQSGC